MYTTRRRLMAGLAGASFALSPLAGGLIARPARAAATGPGVAPEEAIAKLMAGNARHRTGSYTASAVLKERMARFTEGQSPFCIIITCSDSRVVPDIIFDSAPGDIFVMRVAGNIVSPLTIGSAEYAATALNVRLVMVLGHSKCGAVGAAVTEVQKGEAPGGELGGLVREIVPAVVRARRRNPADLLQAAVEENAMLGVDRISASMPVMAPLVTSGQVKVVGAVYDLGSGAVKLVN